MWVNVLSGQEDFEEHRASLTARIDETVHAAARLCPGACAEVTTVGGFPDFRDPLQSSALWRFNRKVRFWRRDEVSGDAHQDGLSPSQTLQLAHRTCDSIHEGNFVGAAAIAELASNADAIWPVAVSSASQYLLGYHQTVSAFAQKLPEESSFRKCLQALNVGEMPLCLLSAMRAEAALSCTGRPDVIQAVIQSVVFGDVAMMEFADRSFRRGHKRKCVDYPRARFLVDHSIVEPRHIEEALPWDSNARRYSWLGTDKLRAVVEKHPKLLKGNSLAIPVCEFWDALMEREEAPSKDLRIQDFGPKDFRNCFVHSATTQQHLAWAPRVMASRKLWDLKHELGARFLGAPRARAVLQAFGLDDPPSVYRGLVASLIECIEENPLPRR